MVKKLSREQRIKQVWAQTCSTLEARVKERNEEIQTLKTNLADKQEHLDEQHTQIQKLMQNLLNPPYIIGAAETQSTLRQLEGQVKSAMQWMDKEKGKNTMLRAQLLLANRALSQFLKPTA